VSIIDNRPGLPAIGYRVGTYATFRQAMLARLPALAVAPSDARPLAALTTRSPDDPTIALLDAWAVVAEVISFYQERIANEGFLRTATEQGSVVELARTIGYELRPGVAASTSLAFTVDNSPGSPTTAAVPRGTKVQSLPAGGGLPQTFETTTDFTARAAWNILRPQLSEPQVIDAEVSTIFVRGQPTHLEPGRMVAIIQVDDFRSFFRATLRQIIAGEYDPSLGGTKVTLAGPTKPPSTVVYRPDPARFASPTSTRRPLDAVSARAVLSADWREPDLAAYIQMQGWDPDALVAFAARIRTRSSFVNAAETLTEKVVIDITATSTDSFASLKTATVTGTLNLATPPGDLATMLFSVIGQIVIEDHDASGQVTRAVATISGVMKIQEAFVRIEADLVSPTLGKRKVFMDCHDQGTVAETGGYFTALLQGEPPLLDPNSPLVLPPAEPGVFAFAVRAAAFGNNAPDWNTVPGHGAVPYKDDWDWGTYWPLLWFDDKREKWVDADLYLDRVVPEILRGSWLALDDGSHVVGFQVTGVRERSLVAFALTGRATGVTVRANYAEGPFIENLDFGRRTTTIHAGSQPLDLAGVPLEVPFGLGTAEARQLTLDSMVLGLGKGQPVIVAGERADLAGTLSAEVAVVDQVIHHGGLTTLFFLSDLQHIYVRQTATITANVVPATHGETTHQVLGSGDAKSANQRFALNKPPLTYVAAPTPSGAASTLEVRVGGLRWDEVPALYGLDHGRPAYIIRADRSGKATVIFGDGVEGSRLPTGTENVTAVYRSGLGMAGQVGAGSLTLLQTRPPGVRSVTNPVAASGAADPERLAAARANAPRTVLTMDRIVSTRDFEDFAQGFAGVGKAQAVALQSAEAAIVHLTVAGADGSVIDPTAKLFQSLTGAIGQAVDPVQRYLVAAHQPRAFNLAAAIAVDPRHETGAVLAAVQAALLQAFSFEQRSFGQPVSGAEVVTVIQAVPGVVASDLERLFRVDDPAGPTQTRPESFVAADRAHLDNDWVLPAELLLLNPSGLELSEMLP